MNILNQSIHPGGHPAFPAAKDSSIHQMPASVRFDGLPTQQSHSPRWKAQTLRRASGNVGVEHDEAAAAVKSAGQETNGTAVAPFQPLTLNFLRSLLDRDTMCPLTDAGGEGGSAAAAAAPPLIALRVVVSSAVALDAGQTELIARKMRRITGFVNLTIDNVVDPSLIAGFVISYGLDDSHAIDLSVKGRLAALKNRVDSSDHDDRLHPRAPTPFH